MIETICFQILVPKLVKVVIVAIFASLLSQTPATFFDAKKRKTHYSSFSFLFVITQTFSSASIPNRIQIFISSQYFMKIGCAQQFSRSSVSCRHNGAFSYFRIANFSCNAPVERPTRAHRGRGKCV